MKSQKTFESSKEHSPGPKGCPYALYDAEDFKSYREGKMPDARAVKLFQHVDTCEECQVLLYQCDLQLLEQQAVKRSERLLGKTRELLNSLK